MSQVFISYTHSSPDQELAAELCRFLEKNGLRVFMDAKIRLGQQWVEQIDNQLRNSAYFVVLISAKSLESDMVRREIAMAYKLRKAGRLTILPVRLGFEDTLPYEVGAYLDLIQYAMWHSGESFTSICNTIFAAISGQTTVGVLPKSAPDPERFGREDLERVISELARRIGPLARVLVHRAAKQAATWDELYRLLAGEIPDAEQRRSFQATRPR